MRKARVSWSHHCMLSRTSSIGAIDGQQRAGQALEEAQALPGIGQGPCGAAPALAPPAGGHQPVHFGAPGFVQGRPRGLDLPVAEPVRHRRQRQPPGCPEALAACTTAPCRLASRAASATRRVFPTPRPTPRTTTRPGWPATAPRHSSSSTLNSLNRPTIGAAAIPDRATAAPICGSATPARSGPERAIRRSNACRVAGSGVMASSRSRTEAQ